MAFDRFAPVIYATQYDGTNSASITGPNTDAVWLSESAGQLHMTASSVNPYGPSVVPTGNWIVFFKYGTGYIAAAMLTDTEFQQQYLAI